MSAGIAGRVPFVMPPGRERDAVRTPLAKLLHEVNQPLTGLQCSLEVTLAAPRANEYYVKTLEDGLVLTERMRMLVEAVREVAEMIEMRTVEGKSTACANLPAFNAEELRSRLQETVEDLRPVAEAKQVRLVLEGPGIFSRVRCDTGDGQPVVAKVAMQGIFGLLESAVALAARGSAVRVEEIGECGKDCGEAGGGFRVRWQPPEAEPPRALSRPELALLVAQARLERGGALWEREQTLGNEVLTVRMKYAATGAGPQELKPGPTASALRER